MLASSSAGNCYIISDGTTELLLEAGIPFGEIQKGCNFRLTSLAGCLITHEHNDHAKAGAELMKRSVDIYTSQGTADAKKWSGHRLHPVRNGEAFTIGTFSIMPFDLVHDCAEPLGFVITSLATREKLLYVTDTHYVRYTFEGLTHIMTECNYDREILIDHVRTGEVQPFLAKRIMESHMSLDTVLDMLRANDLSRVQQIYLLHISEGNSNAEAFKERVQRLTGAEVYVCI
ncbi:MAG: MBL fold metallo-hydrolase [Defluviitaleaceae bacterium]|nr:MBL fold metallo-hydrolase [Defluviitaleaceae bacterium]